MVTTNVVNPIRHAEGWRRALGLGGCAIALAATCAARTGQTGDPAPKAVEAAFGARLEFPTIGDGKPMGLAAADLDGDGADELVALTIAPPALQIWSRVPRGARQWPEPRAYPIDDFALGPVRLGGPRERADGAPLLFSSRTKPGITVVDARATFAAPRDAALVVQWHVDLPRRARVLASGDLGADGVPEVVVITIDDELVIARSPDDVRTFPLDEAQATCACVTRDGRALYVGFQARRELVRYEFDAAGKPVVEARAQLGGLPRAVAEFDAGNGAAPTVLVAGGEDAVWSFRVDAGQLVAGPTFDGGTIPIALATSAPRDGERAAGARPSWIAIGLRGLTATVGGDDPARKLARFYAGQQPVAAAVGDFDGDGATDLALANADARRVSIAFGDGSGGFVTARLAATGRGVHSLATGDVNGDGSTDVVALGAGDGTLNVHVNRGGVLQPAAPQGYMRSGDALRLADLDGDGALDAVCVRDTDLGTVIDVAFGDGRGAFVRRAEVAPWPVGASPGDLWVGDLDGDGRLELVTTDPKGARVHVTDTERIPGPGLRLGPTRVLDVADGPGPIAVLDAAGDARPEFAIGLAGGARHGLVLLGVARDGATRPVLSELRFVAGEDETKRLAVGDFDRDGHADLAALESKSDAVNRVRVSYQGADRTFGGPVSTFAAGARAYAIRAGDIDGNGTEDLFVTAQNAHHVNLWLNGGSAAGRPAVFAPVADLGAGTGPLDLCLVDLRGDGGLNLVVADSFANDVATIRLR